VSVPWTTIDAAAEQLALHPRTIRRAISNGELPGYKFGKALRLRADEVAVWAESKRIPSATSR
jgi:excisionase family DNA binding protein